jgi:thioredoxin-like negative regulator of GroEL
VTKRRPGPVETATKAEIDQMPERVRNGALAASALELARQMDAPGNSATSKSMCAKAHSDIVARLAEMAPPKREEDRIDELGARRATRRSKGVAGT